MKNKNQANCASASSASSATELSTVREARTPEQIAAELLTQHPLKNISNNNAGVAFKQIADAVREAVQAEREACLKIATHYDTSGYCSDGINAAWHIGHLIRQRNE